MVPPSIGVGDASAYEPCAGWVLTRVAWRKPWL